MGHFGYPDLMRAGLGNMLYPWARCVLWCRSEQAEMLAPRWFKLRLGPYLRREADKRRYDRLFRSEGYVRGGKRALVLTTGDVQPEGAVGRPLSGWRPHIVRFQGLRDYFTPLLGAHDPIRTELTRITKPALRPTGNAGPFIAVHVRCGDFTDEMRQPIDWYVAAVRALRSELGDVAVRLYSDGRPDELEPLLRCNNLVHVQGQSAITDMLEMANGKVVVASTSTFSMWGAFLGDRPSIWFPGRLWQRPTATQDRQVEWEGNSSLPSTFIEQLTGAP
jgi:hypothetical protein